MTTGMLIPPEATLSWLSMELFGVDVRDILCCMLAMELSNCDIFMDWSHCVVMIASRELHMVSNCAAIQVSYVSKQGSKQANKLVSKYKHGNDT